STRDGRVLLRWRWQQKPATDRLLVEWQENGGPPIAPRPPTGCSTSTIPELIPLDLGGKADPTVSRAGLRRRVESPAEWTSAASVLTSDVQRGRDEAPWPFLIARQQVPQPS